MKWLNNYLIPYYNSHLYIAFSLWLVYTLITVGHEFIASLMIVSAVIKLLGIYADRPTLRLIGLVGLNVIWGIGFYQFLIGQHPAVALSYHFPAFVLLFGVGISLRGRFGGR